MNKIRFHKITFQDAVIYDEWRWTLETSIISKCSGFAGGNWDPSYMLCMRAKLPKSKTVTFKAKPNVNPGLFQINWNNPVFAKLEPIDDLMAAYRTPCEGDSGSGQMFLAYDKFGGQNSKTFKLILAAIYKGRTSSKFKVKGKKFTLRCGAYTYDADADDYIESLAISQSISSPKIYNWIRKIIKTY